MKRFSEFLGFLHRHWPICLLLGTGFVVWLILLVFGDPASLKDASVVPVEVRMESGAAKK